MYSPQNVFYVYFRYNDCITDILWCVWQKHSMLKCDQSLRTEANVKKDALINQAGSFPYVAFLTFWRRHGPGKG